MGSSQSSKLEEQILTLQIENEKLGKENDELKLSKSNCEVCEPCNYFQYVTKSEYNDLNNKNIECQASNSILEDSLKTLKEKSDSVDKQLKDLSDKNTSLASDKAELESKYNDIVQKYGRGDDERSDDMKLNGDEVPDETPDETPDIKSDETLVDTPDIKSDETPDETPDIKFDETPVEVPDDKESYSFKKNDVVKIIVIIILLIFSLYMVYICYKNEVNEVTETNEENEIM